MSQRDAAAAPSTRPSSWSLLRLEDAGHGILAIVFDRPGSRVNLIDETWVREVDEAIRAASEAGAAGLLFLSAKPGQFVAGADVSLIAGLETAEEAERKSRIGQALFGRIESLPIPTVAAIAGPCLGGGFELALACRFRVAASDDRVSLGLPEVRLGILPGFGGTVRLPRLAGGFDAIELATTGRSIRVKEARRRGLVDRVVPREQLIDAAIAMAREEVRRPPKPFLHRAAQALAFGTAPARALTRALLRARVQRETKGHYPAPLAIVDRIVEGTGLSPHEAMAREARAFGELAVSPVARNLIALYEVNESLAKASPGSPRVDDATERAAVIGAGIMGGGIAGALAEAGIEVRLKDVAIEPLRVGLAVAAAPLARRVRRRRLTPRERDAILARISPTTTATGLARIDVAIEAVPEILELKERVLRELETLIPESAFLATNTSSLPIARIAKALRSPERFVGIHFFNPVHRMPLVEIIPGAGTRPDVVARAVALARRLGKSPIVVVDAPGFLVNRVLLPYLNEAALAVEEGWPIDAIDRALERFGMPMGPLRVVDEVGLDVAHHVARVLEEGFGPRAKAAGILNRLLAAKQLGVKTGRGFWIHEGRRTVPNIAFVGAPRIKAPPDGDIVDRMLLGMVNESSRCLAEGVVTDARHLDLGTVMGAGFPPFRGGIRRWALATGEDAIRRKLSLLEAAHGPRFGAAESLGELFCMR